MKKQNAGAAKSVSGCVLMSEVIHNTERRLGAATIYFPCFVKTRDGYRAALFTSEDLKAAIRRADSNKEDVPERPPLLTRVINYAK